MNPSSIPPIANNFNQWPNWNFTLAKYSDWSTWGLFCISCVIFALNRCVEVYSEKMADKLFGGQRTWFWSIPGLAYGALFSSIYDTPPIYNSVQSCYLFQIDFRPGAPPVQNWVCFANSCWVMTSLIIVYSLLLYKVSSYQDRIEKSFYKDMQRKVMLQSFWICFCVFLIADANTSAGFIRITNNLRKCTTMALQFCLGSTSILYLTLNKTIRRGVKDLLTGRKGHVSPKIGVLSTGKISAVALDA